MANFDVKKLVLMLYSQIRMKIFINSRESIKCVHL